MYLSITRNFPEKFVEIGFFDYASTFKSIEKASVWINDRLERR